MTYKHLAGRLIETQRSMLGQPAIDIAGSIEGLTVDDDGTVTGIDGDGRAVVAELAGRYTEKLGGAAETRLRTAAREFEDELALPPALGGPEDPEGDRDGSASAIDGTRIEVEAPDERGGDTRGDGKAQTGTPEAAAVGTATATREATPGVPDGTAGPADADGVAGGPAIAEYTAPDDAPGGGDLDSVYLLTEDEHGWKTPIAVGDAIADAVAGATDMSREQVGDVADYVETERILSTLDTGDAVSFEVEGITVTLHSNGTVGVR